MPPTIESYGLIGNCKTAALVRKDGSIDWFCSPRFDSKAWFAALLGTSRNGLWRISPIESAESKGRYKPHTVILETTWITRRGSATVVDFMPVGNGGPSIIRIVRGNCGTVKLRTNLRLRFDYGRERPSMSRDGEEIVA